MSLRHPPAGPNAYDHQLRCDVCGAPAIWHSRVVTGCCVLGQVLCERCASRQQTLRPGDWGLWRLVGRSLARLKQSVGLRVAALWCFLWLLALSALATACGGRAEPTLLPESSSLAVAPTPTALSAPTVAAEEQASKPGLAGEELNNEPAPPPTPIAVTPEATPRDTPRNTPVPTPPPPPTPTRLPPFDPTRVTLELELLADGLERPVFATHARDGSNRIFILEQAGVIQVLDAGQRRPFLDIRDRVGSRANEQGLLGLAFDRNFGQNGRFFVYYTNRNGDTTISRFQANADHSLGDPASEVILLTVEQPAANHNGGMLAFGPDGMLYAGLGDGGAANDRFGNGQNLSTLLGTLIRIDVVSSETYAVPADNPFVGHPDARPEIWAYGLRNPWRFSFDRATGDLYIADVGQNRWEEVNFQPADSPGGENYGWPIMEGLHCFGQASCDTADLVLPVVEYGHDQGCSVTGGYVYRGLAQPSLYGAYFYGDFCSGKIWALSRTADGQWLNSELLDSDLQISSFGETEAGEVLVVDLQGMVYRLVDQG